MTRPRCLGTVALFLLFALKLFKPVAGVRTGYARTSPASTEEEALPVISAALGWGVSPVTESFTSPLCLDEKGLVRDGVRSLTTSPITPSVASYSNFEEMKLALSSAGMGSAQLLSPIANGILTTLNVKYASHLSKGSRILHVQYDVPMEERSIGDVVKACAGSPLFEQAVQGLTGNTTWTNKTLDQFFELYGNRIVDKATYGGRLDIFRLDESTGGGVNLTFLGQDGDRQVGQDRKLQHTSVIGGEWVPMNNKTLMQHIGTWMKSVTEERRKLSVLQTSTFSMELLFPEELRERVADSIHRVSRRQSKFQQALQDINFYLPRLAESRAKMEKAGTTSLLTLRALIMPPVQGKIKEVLELMDFTDMLLKPFCFAVADYETYYDQAVALHADETPPLSFKRACQSYTRWACDIRLAGELSQVDSWGPEGASDVRAVFVRGLSSIQGTCGLLRELVNVS